MIVKKAVRRVVHRVVERLVVRPATKRVDRVRMFGLTLEIPPTVFHPAFYLSSKFLGSYLETIDLEGKELLDMGCGSGILGCIAARRGAHVTAVDINPAAAASARNNARINHLEESIRVVEEDLFRGTVDGGAFDYIVWNPPFFPKEPADAAGRAWDAGEGFEVICRFGLGAGEHLCQGGKIIVVLSSDTDTGAIRERIREAGFRDRVVWEKRKMFERLYIVEFEKAKAGGTTETKQKKLKMEDGKSKIAIN